MTELDASLRPLSDLHRSHGEAWGDRDAGGHTTAPAWARRVLSRKRDARSWRKAPPSRRSRCSSRKANGGPLRWGAGSEQEGQVGKVRHRFMEQLLV